jgi:predicted dehydrogenase
LSQPVGVLIVGAGLMGRWHADAARRAGGRIVAVVDPDLSRARALAARHGAAALPEVSAALQSAASSAHQLSSARPESSATVAHVCTQPGTHASLASQLLERGIAVLVEKPFARTAAETRQLLDLAARRNSLAVPTHQFLFQPGVLRAFGRLGASRPLRHVEAVACSAGAEGRSGSARDEVVAEILPHALAFLARLFPGKLAATSWHLERPTAGEMRATTVLDGVGISILISMSGRPTRNTLRLIGEKGTAHCDLFHGFAVFEGGGGVSRARKIAQPFVESGATLVTGAANLASRAVRRESAYPGLRELVRRFYDAVVGRGPAPISADETLAVAEARDALVALMRA